tara:strand:- start:178 stop:1491 length:1314 start_codon:yes stop_codon:yes gene_type:complete
MALIVDPDDLNQGVEINIDTATKTFTLNIAGNLSNDGVTGQALYSFFKEEWKNDAALIAYDFPMTSITTEQFEFIKDWVPADDATRNLLRTAGWREITDADVLEREYVGVVSLGNIDPGDTAYYAFASDSAKTDFDFPGTINQGVQTFGNASNGNFDKRSEVLTLYIRIQGKLYGLATTTEIGLTDIPYNTQRFPLSEAADLKITASDNDIDTLAPYTGMSITYGTVTRNIGGTNYDFDVLIDGNNGTAEQIYEFVQRELRKSTDIDDGAGTVIGELADSLLEFVGDTLKTKNAFIDNFQANDTNRIVFEDNTGAEVTFPFVAAGSLNFNINLQNDPEAVYRMFFSSGFGSPSAIIVQDNSGTPISGDVNGAASVSFDFDYDGNNQGGRTPGTDAAITVVAIGEGTAQYVLAEGVITRAVGQGISLVSTLERNYSNP